MDNRADNLPCCRFSVIIVHRNRVELLAATLAAVTQALSLADEVIVVDNGSCDESVSYLQRHWPNVRLIANPCNAGYARACNQGIRQARGHYLLLLNNDALLPERALDHFVADFAANPRLALIGARLVGPDGKPQRSGGQAPNWQSELGLKKVSALYPSPQEPGLLFVESVVGACMALRREAIETAGLLDEDFFFYFEETEWCVRLRRRGWLIAIDPAVTVIHQKGGSTRSIRLDAQIEALRSRLIYYRKTMPPWLALTLTFYRLFRLLINTTGTLILVVLTIGSIDRLRQQCAAYGIQLLWLFCGCPKRWGLPDKCNQKSFERRNS